MSMYRVRRRKRHVAARTSATPPELLDLWRRQRELNKKRWAGFEPAVNGHAPQPPVPWSPEGKRQADEAIRFRQEAIALSDEERVIRIRYGLPVYPAATPEEIAR